MVERHDVRGRQFATDSGRCFKKQCCLSARFLDCPVAGWCQRNKRGFMMNQTNGWMGGWAGGGMWIWTVIGVVVVVLLVVVISKLSKK
jgi:hypothetical protein